MKTLTDKPGLTIIHDPDHHWLHVIWRGSHNEAEGRAECLLILEKIRQTSCTKILNDASLDLDGWNELIRWIAKEFLLLLAEAGVTAIAWVLPHNLRARIDTNNVMDRQTRPLVDTFTDIEEAYAWLRNVA